MRVLLAILSDGGVTGSCTLGFAVGLMRLQAALLSSKGVQAVVELLPSVKAAAAQAREGGYDAAVALATDVAFPPSFVTRALEVDAPFVAGVYPLPRLDWGRVKARADDEREATRFKGNTYNVDAASARPTVHTGYLAVRSAGLSAVVLKKEAIEALAGCPESSDAALCEAWGRDILVDLEHQCATMGPLEFMGCVGLRATTKT